VAACDQLGNARLGRRERVSHGRGRDPRELRLRTGRPRGTLIEAEIASRDESNLQARVKLAGFPVRKTLDDFKVQASSLPEPTFDYLAGLEWIRAKENSLLVGPAGTGKSHLLIGLGLAAV
jgi:DNA replication protein DnaC